MCKFRDKNDISAPARLKERRVEVAGGRGGGKLRDGGR